MSKRVYSSKSSSSSPSSNSDSSPVAVYRCVNKKTKLTCHNPVKLEGMEEVLDKLDKLDQGQKEIRSAIQNLKQCNAKIAEFDQTSSIRKSFERKKHRNVWIRGGKERGLGRNHKQSRRISQSFFWIYL